MKDIINYNDIFIIGGEQIYKQFLDIVQTIYLTEIYDDSVGDAKFEFNENEFVKIYSEPHREYGIDYSLNIYERKRF